MTHTVRSTGNFMTLSIGSATGFVVLMGIVSLFSDFTYEGSRSIIGPFFAVLGASGTVVGIVGGLGELLGYTLRLATGYLADKTRQYWAMVFVGFAVNLLAVPLLALAGRWEIAAILVITERIGKAIRTPARDVMLSYASERIGRGWGFGLHEALDQIGAVLGPLAVAAVFHFTGRFQTSFGFLLIPALIALGVLFASYMLYPNPRDLRSASVKLQSKGFSLVFWLYVGAIGCVAAGFADFSLVAYHFQRASSVPEAWIPIFYAVAMGVDAIAALIFGRLFDRIGFSALVLAVLLSSLFAPLVFMGGFYVALAGMALWGIGMGAQESIARAAVATIAPQDRLGYAFGLFNTIYGVAWFAGSAVMGLLYDLSITALVYFSVLFQALCIVILLATRRLVRA